MLIQETLKQGVIQEGRFKSKSFEFEVRSELASHLVAERTKNVTAVAVGVQ